MKELTSETEWEACLAASAERPVMVFKHSTACGNSANAYREVVQFLGSPPPHCPDFYLVKVIESRPVSNAIATRLEIPHKSPQLILIRDQEAVWSTSHHGIHGKNIASALERILTRPE